MRLIKIKLKDFRRFAGEQSLDLNEDVIALVGPNEAGKSSLLGALDLIGSLRPPGMADTTRGLPGPATVSPLFVLEPEDRALLMGIHDGDKVTHLWIDLIAGWERSVWRPEPYPSRDLGPRSQCRGLVETLQGDPGLDAAYSASEEWVWDPEVLVGVRGVLAGQQETLSNEAISSLESLGHRLRAIRFPAVDTTAPDQAEMSAQDLQRAAARESAASALFDLAGIERQPRPVQQVVNALSGRTPAVALFRELDRDLQSTYRLDEVAARPPRALRNFCALADLDLAAAHSEIASGRWPHVEAVFEAANRRLRERFSQTWMQSVVYPRLSTPLDGVMRIMVSVEGGGDYAVLEQRSEGLRWFMALHAFLSAHGKKNPVLLIDEAETHLHYDAQADLIDALMSQRIARQVIYTTHSVGCLPPDLGCGLRVVVAEKDAERSRIANSYWTLDPDDDQKVGYAPLLFAMGARMLSLTLPRFGVITEGPGDAILLPSLLRDATGLPRLPYRVVPGLAEVADADVQSLSHRAGKVVTLADGDAAGLAICEKLRSAGIAPSEIFNLGQVRAECALEDIVDPAVLADAINRELDTWRIGPLRVAATDLPATGRWAWLKQQCVASGTPLKRLSKARIAQRVVEIGREARESASPRALIDPNDILPMKHLHEALCDALELKTPSEAS
jgi:hypothetical protein